MISRKLHAVKELWFFRLKNLALDLRLFDAHRDYSKFIILGEGRSGSNFFRSLLNSHGQVIAFGELFRFHESIGWDLSPYDHVWQSERLIQLFKSDPVSFLEEKVFRRFPKTVAAVGFKLFYYHANDEPRNRVWSYLKNQNDLKVIHLKRQNTLRIILSLKKAFMTNKWENRTGTEEDKLSIHLDYEECLRRFEDSDNYKRQYDKFFEGKEMIEVIYETLEANYTAEMRRVQGFLGVSQKPVKASIYKQSTLALSKAISNYYELKEQFYRTPWENFFEE